MMKQGVWFQLGWQTQTKAIEQLPHGYGAGAIISLRDLTYQQALTFSQQNRNNNAEILLDLQFYDPTYYHANYSTYPIMNLRNSIGTHTQISPEDKAEFRNKLKRLSIEFGVTAILSPGIIYEAGREDIKRKNFELLNIAKMVGDELGIPTYATVCLSHSVLVSDRSTSDILTNVTALNCDGYYLSIQTDSRIVNKREELLLLAKIILTLASTGRNVFHAFAGPLSLFTICFGAKSVGLGQCRNLWNFSRIRFDINAPKNEGRNGGAVRLFSKNLWGTFVYPEELTSIQTSLASQLLTRSPFTLNLNIEGTIPIRKAVAQNHLLYVIGTTIENLISTCPSYKDRTNEVISMLRNAEELIFNIRRQKTFKDETFSYQQQWRNVLETSLDLYADQFAFLELLS